MNKLMNSCIYFHFSFQYYDIRYYISQVYVNSKVSLTMSLGFYFRIGKLSYIWNEFIESVKSCLE